MLLKRIICISAFFKKSTEFILIFHLINLFQAKIIYFSVVCTTVLKNQTILAIFYHKC